MTLVNDTELEKMMNNNCDTDSCSSSVISIREIPNSMEANDIPAVTTTAGTQGPQASKRGKPHQGLMDITELSPELLSAYKIVSQLMSTSNKLVNYAFMNPIDYSDPENYNYTNVIKKPMWLNKVKLKLLSGRYQTISQVIRDLRLVLENCYRFYGPTHHVTKKAIKLETMLEQKLALLPRELKEKTSLQLTTPELVTKVENNVKPSGSKATQKLGSHKDESSVILNCVRQAKAKREREARRLQMEEKRAERDVTQHELVQWEESFYGKDLDLVKKMWEVPQIGHFLYLVQTVLNIPEVSQFELERAFLTPQCSSLLACLMTSLLSSPQQRTKLDEIPSMPYNIWQSRLKMKVQSWYKTYLYKHRSALKVFEITGIEAEFFSILGEENPLETKQFHEMTLKQRVWLVKSMCDYCLHNHKSIQEAIFESSFLDQKEYYLGNDKEDSVYIHFPQFCGQSLRVYKQYFDDSDPPNMEFPVVKIEESNTLNEVVKNDKKIEKKCPVKEEEKVEEAVSTPVSRRKKGRRAAIWSSRKRKPRKKVLDEELENEEKEEVKPKINPFFELIVDNIESLRKLTESFSGKDWKDLNISSAPATPCSSQATTSLAPSPNPEEMLSETPPSSRATRRSKLLATIALKKVVAATEVKKKEEKVDSEPEEIDENNENQNVDERSLYKRLKNLLKELEPWEQKLDQADRKMRFKLRKEWEDFQLRGENNDDDIANEYWGGQNALKVEEELVDSDSSSDSFYIKAEQELANLNQVQKEDVNVSADTNPVPGSEFRINHYRRCTKRQKVMKNDPISSSSEVDEESDDSTGSAKSFQITVSSRGRIRKTKNFNFNLENQVDKKHKTIKELSKPMENKQDSNDAQLQYQWETMRQLLVENSPKETAFNTKKAMESATSSPQQQPILENLLASQPGFGLMKVPTKTSTAQATTSANLSNEPKYLQSFIQKHYTPPALPKLSPTKGSSPSVGASQPSRHIIFRQNKDGGRRVIETTFSKPGIMKTTVSTNDKVIPNSLPQTKLISVNQRVRQPCYANANSTSTSPVTSSVTQQNLAPTVRVSLAPPPQSHTVSVVSQSSKINEGLPSQITPSQSVINCQLGVKVPQPKGTIIQQHQQRTASQIRILMPPSSTNVTRQSAPPPIRMTLAKTVNNTQQSQIIQPISDAQRTNPHQGPVLPHVQQGLQGPPVTQSNVAPSTENSSAGTNQNFSMTTQMGKILVHQQNIASANRPLEALAKPGLEQQIGIPTSSPEVNASQIATMMSTLASVSGQQITATNSNSNIARRVVLTQYRGQNLHNLQAGQKIPPLILKVVSTRNNNNNSCSPAVQTASGTGFTIAKLVKSGSTYILKQANNIQSVAVSNSSLIPTQQKFVTSNNVVNQPTLYHASSNNLTNVNPPLFQSNPTLVQFSNPQSNQVLGQMNVPQGTCQSLMTAVVGNNCNTIPLQQAQENQLQQSVQREINLNQHQIVLNNPNLGHQISPMGQALGNSSLASQPVPLVNQHMLNNSNEDISSLSMNQQSIINVGNNLVSQQPATSQMNAVIVPCPLQIQSPNSIQYVTQQMMTAPTVTSPVMHQTNQRVLVCSSSNASSVNAASLFQNNQNSGNVYFLTNSGQLMATNTLPSVSHSNLLNDVLKSELQNL